MTDKSEKFSAQEWLKATRGELTKEAFAKIIGVSVRHYYRYESGEKPIPQWIVDAANKYIRDKSQAIADPKNAFDPHGGWKPRSIEEMTGVPKGLGLGKAVDLLATIYAAKDEMLIRAINANLEAFCSAVGEKERRIEREQDLQRLEERVKELENIISKNGPVQVYAGPERRRSTDRRVCCDQDYPEPKNQRTGSDRRETPV
jgi:hypothetical protein